MTANEVLDRLEKDIAWRGPSGKPLGNIVLEREDAAALLNIVRRFAIEYVIDHGAVALREKYGIEITINVT